MPISNYYADPEFNPLVILKNFLNIESCSFKKAYKNLLNSRLMESCFAILDNIKSNF